MRTTSTSRSVSPACRSIVGARWPAGLGTAWVEKTFIGARGFDFDLSPIERVLLACRALWFYAAKLVWPANLTFIYPRWDVDAGQAWQYIFVVLTAAVFVALWLLRTRTRAPLAAALLFAGTLFPALGFFDVFPFRYSFVADHFQYLATVSLIALVAAGVHRRLRVASFLILVPLAVLTWQQSHEYVNAETLYRATLEKNPACWLCHNNLGAMRMAEGRVDAALPHLEESLRLNPRNAEALNNLGYVRRVQGRYEDAVRAHEESLRLAPNVASTLTNLGVALHGAGRHDEALARYQEAVRLAPRLPEAHHNIGRVLQEMGRAGEALTAIEMAIQLRPDYADAWDNKGNALLRLQRTDEAIRAFQQASKLAPGDERLRGKLAALYVREGDGRLDHGRPQEAIPYYRAALDTPALVDAPMVHNNLGIALAMTGDIRSAAEQFIAALRLRPDFPEARQNLARAQRRD